MSNYSDQIRNSGLMETLHDNKVEGQELKDFKAKILSEMNLKKVHATKDDDGHWYVIPAELIDEFHKLLEGGESTEEEFIGKFRDYMTGGDLNLVQLYAEIK